ncbi:MULTISPECIES: hypothetical protein, partial [Pandoraea]|uniref:hypothetical protein n=1 Tax=Pandoraea TaxID=93217 RepID=UPI001F5D8BD0
VISATVTNWLLADSGWGSAQLSKADYAFCCHAICARLGKLRSLQADFFNSSKTTRCISLKPDAWSTA